MKYYSYYGVNDFILCLGYKGEAIKQYFLNYEESVSNDFVLSEGGRNIELLASDIDDWRITFADTGKAASIGERLMAVRRYLGDDEFFLANYADGLTDLHLPDQIAHFRRHDRVASFLCVKPSLSYHYIDRNGDGVVEGILPFGHSDLRVNGGFFVLRRNVFDYMEPGDDLVEPTFQRLIDDRQLVAYDYDGFWHAVDTAKDKARVDELHAAGNPPWAVWDRRERGAEEPDRAGGERLEKGAHDPDPVSVESG
jgi:glucose-1-phosphate cytidylyltransferase